MRFCFMLLFMVMTLHQNPSSGEVLNFLISIRAILNAPIEEEEKEEKREEIFNVPIEDLFLNFERRFLTWAEVMPIVLKPP